MDTSIDSEGHGADSHPNMDNDIEREARPPLKPKLKPEPQLETKSRLFLDGILNKRIRVDLTDTRYIIGRLVCTDKDCNLVMSESVEHGVSKKINELSNDDKNNSIMNNDDQNGADSEHNTQIATETGRHLGIVMVPGNHIVRLCEARNVLNK